MPLMPKFSVAHWVYIMVSAGVALVSTIQADSHHTLMVGGIGALGVMTMLRALFSAPPEA